MKLINSIKKLVFPRPKLSREVFEAYFNRLPSDIEVNWFRDGKYIVGNVDDGERKFMTQGVDADNFIEMVNDAILAINGVSDEYVDAIKSAKTYRPDQEQYKKLLDGNVQSAVIFARKDMKVLELA